MVARSAGNQDADSQPRIVRHFRPAPMLLYVAGDYSMVLAPTLRNYPAQKEAHLPSCYRVNLDPTR